MAIILARKYIDNTGRPSPEVIKYCIKKHQVGIERLTKLNDYYNGDHAIKDRPKDTSLANNKLVCNHAEYITDIATGYMMTKPVTYSSDKDIKAFNDSLDESIETVDTELTRDISKFGIGYELVYMSSDDSPVPKSTNIDPRNIFLVVDNTVEFKSMFAVHYFEQRDLDDKVEGYVINVYTDSAIIEYWVDKLDAVPVFVGETQHYFGGVPVIEYWNKSNQQGDFEGVISLIDAYNVLQSDRVNDKEQLVDAFLAVSGVSFGDTEEEMTKTAKLLKKEKFLELPEGAKAEWLIKIMNEDQIEVLKKAIKEDIHEFSKVPCLTDQNFVGNASGVAMKYKLLGFVLLGNTKESYYRIGLRERVELYCNILNTKGHNIDPKQIVITLHKELPTNEAEIYTYAQIVSLLKGIVSQETLLNLLSFVKDPTTETEKAKEEQKQALKDQSEAFGSYDFPQE